MIRALRTAASGMYAQQLNLDNTANNLANVNTTGFKKGQIQFQDLMYQTLRHAGLTASQEQAEPVQLEIGHGVQPVAITKSFSQGTLTQTDNPLDMAINGTGFFQILLPDGSLGYTRDGNFALNAEGEIVTADGYALEPELRLPFDTEQVLVGREGNIAVIITGRSQPEEIGQIELARFINPAGLESIGRNLFVETVSSGDPIYGEAGLDGLGEIEQGFLETSNVSVVEEMMQMILAQHAYELNTKSVRTADEMLSQSANLKR
ncbi:MAG: flagellar basal-body rod protein FlgG [bacterium]